ncbi:MAG: amidohydrolase family protein [Pseudomonadota bacterium]
MQGKIALEEHFAIPETLQDSSGFVPDRYWQELSSRLTDIHDGRLREMDANGIELMILSLNAPAVQAIRDHKQAIDVARKANDQLAEKVQQRSDRFQAFAALPMQDPEAATAELTRCVKDLGFRGALVNGFSDSAIHDVPLYYDLPQYRPFWAEVEALNVPFYLHPRNPLAKNATIYDGHPWLMGPTWAFGQETAVHALRLMGSGLFDEHPRLNVILGHMGEGLPYSMWRIDHRNAWVETTPSYPAKRKIADYFNENFFLTTSGNFRTQTLIDAILEVGSDRILFSTDWPFENVDHASNWFDDASISERDRRKIGRENAVNLFQLQDQLTDTSA